MNTSNTHQRYENILNSNNQKINKKVDQLQKILNPYRRNMTEKMKSSRLEFIRSIYKFDHEKYRNTIKKPVNEPVFLNEQEWKQLSNKNLRNNFKYITAPNRMLQRRIFMSNKNETKNIINKSNNIEETHLKGTNNHKLVKELSQESLIEKQQSAKEPKISNKLQKEISVGDIINEPNNPQKINVLDKTRFNDIVKHIKHPKQSFLQCKYNCCKHKLPSIKMYDKNMISQRLRCFDFSKSIQNNEFNIKDINKNILQNKRKIVLSNSIIINKIKPQTNQQKRSMAQKV